MPLVARCYRSACGDSESKSALANFLAHIVQCIASRAFLFSDWCLGFLDLGGRLTLRTQLGDTRRIGLLHRALRMNAATRKSGLPANRTASSFGLASHD